MGTDREYIDDFEEFFNGFRNDTTPVEHWTPAIEQAYSEGKISGPEILNITKVERDISIGLFCFVAIHSGLEAALAGGTDYYRDVLSNNFKLRRDEVKTLKTGSRINGLNIAKAASRFGIKMQYFRRIDVTEIAKVVVTNPSVHEFLF